MRFLMTPTSTVGTNGLANKGPANLFARPNGEDVGKRFSSSANDTKWGVRKAHGKLFALLALPLALAVQSPENAGAWSLSTNIDASFDLGLCTVDLRVNVGGFDETSLAVRSGSNAHYAGGAFVVSMVGTNHGSPAPAITADALESCGLQGVSGLKQTFNSAAANSVADMTEISFSFTATLPTGVNAKSSSPFRQTVTAGPIISPIR